MESLILISATPMVISNMAQAADCGAIHVPDGLGEVMC